MPNPYVNKVVRSNGTTLIDISDTTAVAADVAQGKSFYLATGEKVAGSGSGGGSVTWETLYEGSATIVSSSPNYIAINNFSETIGEGETWRITWNGVSYTCEGVYNSQITGCYIGNAHIVDSGSSDTGEPFWAYKRTSSQLAFSTNQSAGTITLVVERQTTSSATLITKTITANGTYSASDDSADGYSEVTVNVPSGASNIVTGTFTGTTAGQTLSVRLNYSGTGYPIAYMIYPSEGMRNANGTFNTTLKRYAIRSFAATMDTLPLGQSTEGSVVASYKNSTSSATSYTSTGTNANTDYPFTGSPSDSNARSVAKLVKGSNGTVLYVYIASNSYGFMPNVEYTYHAVFTS